MVGHFNTKHGNIKQALLQLNNSLLYFFFLFLFNSTIRVTLIKQQALLGFRLLLDADQTSQTHMQTKVQPELVVRSVQRCILWVSDLKQLLISF